MFKAGDKIRVITVLEGLAWKDDTGVAIDSNSWKNDRDGKNYNLSNGFYILEKIGEYEQIKGRIVRLRADATLKEVDNILKDIFPEVGKACYTLKIPVWNESGASIKIEDLYDEVESFRYSSQCEKFKALKEAILWLLDHSNIEKEDKDIEKEDKEGLKKEINELKDRIRDLEKRI